MLYIAGLFEADIQSLGAVVCLCVAVLTDSCDLSVCVVVDGALQPHAKQKGGHTSHHPGDSQGELNMFREIRVNEV